MSDASKTRYGTPNGEPTRRVLVVDDSVTIRAGLKLLINKEPGWEVAATAPDGERAVQAVRELNPDVVVMDYEMPVMNGLEAIRALRAFSRVPVVVLSGHTPRASRVAMELLNAGASDVMCKTPDGPVKGIDALRGPLMERLRALTAAAAADPSRPGSLPTPAPPAGAARGRAGLAAGVPSAAAARLMVVGSSTGGPPALEAFLDALAPSMTAPLVIAQHMPETFTSALAERLDQRGPRPARLAEDGMQLQPGTVYVAPGGQHTQVRRALRDTLRLTVGPDPADAPYRPSVDALFSSAARAVGAHVVGAVLTGMGDDGRIGSRDVVNAGGRVVAQDAASCVVYGMPKAVVDDGLASAVMPPAELGRAISRLAQRAA